MRRAIGMLLGGAPLWVVLTSLWCSLRAPSPSVEGWWLLLPAVFFAGLNSYTSWIRPRLYWRRHGSMQGYRHVSGAPLLGNIFAMSAVAVCFGNRLVTAVALATVLTDTGGTPWFVLWTWRDRSLWEGRD